MPCHPVDAFDLQLPPSRAATEQFRTELRAWLRTTGASDREAFDILTATGEAIANAIEHPLDPSSPLVGLAAVEDNGLVRVSVRDFGTWQHTRQRDDGGHGYTLMRSFMDTVTVLHQDGGTTVVMERVLRDGDAGAHEL